MARLLMPRPIPTLHGKLVTLRAPDPTADGQDYFEMNHDPEMHTWTGNRVLESCDEARAELERFAAMDVVSTWMIVDNPSGKVVGRFFIVLEERGGKRIAGEGNRIAKPYWRKGHNREARRLLFRYVFEELHADLIETGAWAGNVNSIRSIEAHGFRLDRTEEKWNEKHGRTIDMRYYVLAREDWARSPK